MRRNSYKFSGKHSGFTLIEVLVAIAIFTTLSFSAYQVLDQTQKSNQQSIEVTGRLKEIQRAMVMIDNDFRQIALRPFRNNGEEASGKLLWFSEGLLDSDSNGVLFVRLGWQNPQQFFPRGEVTKVGYRIRDKQLERVWWRYPDTPAGQQGIVTPLLTDVEELEMRFYGEEGWKSEWSESYSLPKAVELNLTLADYGVVTRVYLTSGAKLAITASDEEVTDE
ncbi:type II secretion system minor pseudopilin GspJ [Vibrio sp. JC009]|uniref:type II secretion system minor pseudopilin GspJ n=1 Tax=Vibrio sp. JC009 TaxID=2912314 RepID=UPI0023AE739F|nr:type II secretion system minor pseudopilin GspJ [Vibrio sp. JC009]WED21931.1 type II secretion system minor pseudopilin GspJ [Vibrio sp. JC009]